MWTSHVQFEYRYCELKPLLQYIPLDIPPDAKGTSKKRGFHTAFTMTPEAGLYAITERLTRIAHEHPDLFMRSIKYEKVKLVFSMDGFSYDAFNGESRSMVQANIRVCVPGLPVSNLSEAHIPMMLARAKEDYEWSEQIIPKLEACLLDREGNPLKSLQV